MSKKRFSVEKICELAALVSVQVVIARLISINTMGLRIGFSFIPVMLAAYMFGPISAGLVSALADVIGALLFPNGPFHPGFTAMAFLSGAVFGLLLDFKGQNDFKYWVKVIVAVVINSLIIGLLVNSFWVSQLYGSKTYTGWILYRLREYAVMVPVQIIFAPIVKRLAQTLTKAKTQGSYGGASASSHEEQTENKTFSEGSAEGAEGR